MDGRAFHLCTGTNYVISVDFQDSRLSSSLDRTTPVTVEQFFYYVVGRLGSVICATVSVPLRGIFQPGTHANVLGNCVYDAHVVDSLKGCSWSVWKHGSSCAEYSVFSRLVAVACRVGRQSSSFAGDSIFQNIL